MKVAKFGGTVLSTPESFRGMTQIVSNNFRGVVVISAIGNTTRKLEFAGRLAQKGLLHEALEAVEQLIADHVLLVKSVIPKVSAREGLVTTFRSIQTDLTHLVEAVSITNQLTPRTMDQILSVGESLALKTVVCALECAGVSVAEVDATNVMITNDRFGSAEPLVEKTRFSVTEYLLPSLELHEVVVVQGFVGSTESGAVTTMGKESSNMTATFLGAMVGAEEIVIYTDVQGVRSADPHVCENTKIRPMLSYRQAVILSESGLKLLYPTMIQPAERLNIPIRITSALEPDGDCTIISSQETDIEPVIIQQDLGNQKSRVSSMFCDADTWLEALVSILSDDSSLPIGDYVASVDSVTGIGTLQVESERQTQVTNLFHNLLCLK